MDNPEPADAMSREVLDRITRVLTFTSYSHAGDEDSALQILQQELDATGGDVLPFSRGMAWLVATVADVKPDDLATWLDDTIGVALADD